MITVAARRLGEGAVPQKVVGPVEFDLRGAPKQLEPSREPVVIRVILPPLGQSDHCTSGGFQALREKRPVVQLQQAIGEVHLVVRIDAGQGIVERRMVNPRERYPIGYDWLAERLIAYQP